MTSTADLDVAYVVRPGDHNEELRYSLRSVTENLPHNDLVIAGHVPTWIDPTKVVGIHVNQHAHSKPANTLGNLHAILNASYLTPEVILMNDDHFVTAPIDAIPSQSLGPAAWVAKSGMANSRRYYKAQLDTIQVMTELGIPDPYSYEGHTPFVADRRMLLKALAIIGDVAETHRWPYDRTAAIHWRTVLGNLEGRPHPVTPQVKISALDHPGPYPRPFLSTNDSTFRRGMVGSWIRSTWRNPSPYERHPLDAIQTDPWAQHG